MVKEIGDIKLYSMHDLNEYLGLKERTIGEWFRKGKLKGVKIGKEWHISEENLRKFLNAEEKGGENEGQNKVKRKQKKGKEGL